LAFFSVFRWSFVLPTSVKPVRCRPFFFREVRAMAKVLYGNMVADARGSVGGVVYSRNTSGAYTRSKVSPVQPSTAGQLNQRNRLIDISKSWVKLTQGQRLAWHNFAIGHPFTDVFGLQKKYSGQQMYMNLNLALLSNGLSLLTDPPTSLFVNQLTSVGLSNTTSGVVGSVAVTAAGTGYTSAPTVGFSGGGGSGAAGTAVLTPSSVASITLGAAGTGYTSVPTVTLTGGGGSGAAFTAVLSGTSVASFTLVSGGSGYTSAPTVSITGGGGASATGTAVLASTGVASVTLTSQGTGYTSAPTVAFTGGAGTGATATATVVTATSGLSVSFTGTVDANTFLEIWASPVVSAGKQYVKNLLRYLLTTTDAPTSPISITAAWQAVFGDLPDVTPYRIVVEANFINIATGARGGRARGDLIQT
jgi:hypothetical protein